MKKMKKLLYTLFALLPLLTGCEKDLMDYEGLEGVYFAVQYGDSWGGERTWPYMPYSKVSFMEVSGNENTVSLRVMVTGGAKDYDRTFYLEANPDSTTAVTNTDYLPIQREWTIKAGELQTDIEVTLLRTELLQEKELTLGLRLVPSPDLTLAFTNFAAVDGHTSGTVIKNFDASLHQLRFDDMLGRPKGWVGTDESPYNGGYESGMFGAYSRKKLELMCELTGLTYADFNKQMPSVISTFVTKKLSAYLIERYNAKDPVLEDDGRLMYCSYVPWMSKIGVPWVAPDDFYN